MGSEHIPNDLKEWLQSHGLVKYYDVLNDNSIDIDNIGSLSSSELKEIGVVSPVDRRRIVKSFSGKGLSGWWNSAKRSDHISYYSTLIGLSSTIVLTIVAIVSLWQASRSLAEASNQRVESVMPRLLVSEYTFALRIRENEDNSNRSSFAIDVFQTGGHLVMSHAEADSAIAVSPPFGLMIRNVGIGNAIDVNVSLESPVNQDSITSLPHYDLLGDTTIILGVRENDTLRSYISNFRVNNGLYDARMSHSISPVGNEDDMIIVSFKGANILMHYIYTMVFINYMGKLQGFINNRDNYFDMMRMNFDDNPIRLTLSYSDILGNEYEMRQNIIIRAYASTFESDIYNFSVSTNEIELIRE